MKNRKTYIEPGFGKWRESEQGDTLRASHGGGEVLIVDVLPFDTTQITHKANYSHPTWGGNAPIVVEYAETVQPSDTRPVAER